MKFNNIVNNFASGEWSPKMRARTDADQYVKACEEMKNFIPYIQGGAYLRSGTRFVPLDNAGQSELVNSALGQIKLIPYNPSSGDAYVLAAVTGLVASWFVVKIQNPIAATTTVTAGTGASNTSDPADFHYVQVGDLILIVDRTGVTVPMVFFLDGSTFRIRTIFEYVALFHATPLYNTQAFPYRALQANGSSVNLTAGAATGSTTLTASAAFFNPGHIGTLFKLTAAGQTGAVLVTGYTSSTVVSVAWQTNGGTTTTVGTAAGTAWEEAAWSDYRGWPKSVSAFQGRLCYGGNATQPDTLWGSRIGNVFDLMEVPFANDPDFTTYTSNNARPFTLAPSSAEVSNIVALTAGKTLVINTDKYEIVAFGSQGALGPLDVNFESSTAFGAANVQPVRVNNFVTFTQRGAQKIRDVIFNFEQDQYKSTDLSFVADHLFLKDDYDSLFYSEIAEMTTTRGNSVLWMRISNIDPAGEITNDLVGVTLDRDYQVNGFFRFETSGIVHAICAAGANLDTLFMIVQRPDTDPNASVIYMEYLTNPYELETQVLTPASQAVVGSYGNGYIKGPTYLDCWKASNVYTAPGVIGPKKTDWSGFDHLAGMTVAVIADGEYIGTQVVTGSGHITTPIAVQVVLVGLPYEGVLKPWLIEQGQQIPGSPQGLSKRIDQLTIKFWKTFGAQYGESLANMYDIDFKDPNVPANTLPQMKTINQAVNFEGNYGNEAQVIIRQQKPWPCNVLAIISRGVLYD